MKNLVYLGILFGGLLLGCNTSTKQQEEKETVEQKEPSEFEKFLIKKDELNLRFKYPDPERKISYKNYKGDYNSWKNEVLQKFTEIIAYEPPGEKKVTGLRSIVDNGITYHALVMEASPRLSIPAYLLIPGGKIKGAVMAVHGHGMVEPVIGTADDYHHRYAFELAKEGYMVLCPELRGFSTLGDLSDDIELDNLDYWVIHGRQFTLVTEGFQHGKTLIGETIADLVAWENWWAKAYHVESFDVAGISYGGDLVLYYPVFSKRVNKIFSSGSLGSFNGIFATCYNAPAHCIPGILEWMDRSDIAGLNAPRPIMLHYGELDTPGPDNHSASYNNTVEPAINELKEIYAHEGAEKKVCLKVTPNSYHEMDNELLKSFLSDEY
jgi:dienelactone hydrolase